MKFFVTFAPGHRRSDPVELTCEGWLEVIAPTREEARALTLAELGRKWSFIYGEEEFAGIRKVFAGGRLATLTGDGFLGINTASEAAQG